jgi:leader peptidase (prepilin peptidase)/N-methyltransferase
MLSWIALACLIGAVALLAALSVTDLKTRLLPNEMVLGFAALGLVFHLTTLNRFLSWQDMVMGGALGFGSLYLLRFIANRMTGQDALGLGDVKLIGAAGLWLGPQTAMIAMSLGAGVSLLHGLVLGLMQAKSAGGKLRLSTLSLPAGPGFACGILMTGVWEFSAFRPELFWSHHP